MKRVGEVKSQNYLLTKFENLIDWAVNSSRANSLWPMPFGTACCAIEFMATAASRYDFARFGMERQAFSPRQADVLICAGRLPFKLAPVIRRIYDQMPQPKWVISMGACASTGGTALRNPAAPQEDQRRVAIRCGPAPGRAAARRQGTAPAARDD